MLRKPLLLLLLNLNDIEMWDAGEDYIYDEAEDEQGKVCGPSVDKGPCANVFQIGAQPRSDKARVSVCPGRKRRIVKVTQWSASARANIA